MGSSSEALYTERVDDALAFAATTFRYVTRKDGGTPYLWHLLAVGAMVGDAGGDEDQVIAGVLHDYLEDIEGGSRDVLASRYGERVATLVEALSDTTVRPKPAWRERKEAHVARMRRASREVKLIAACDKLHNARATLRDLRAIGDAVWERFNGSKDDTLWYYRSMIAALAEGFDHHLVRDLDSTIAALHEEAGVPLTR
jgi:(p)ppGpp synthase/HD superfamily hydrolase